MTTTIKYGLRNKQTGKLIGYYTSANNGDFCVETQYTLSESGESPWLVEHAYHAEWVRCNPTSWYNASYDTPSHSLQTDLYEVVEVKIVTDIVRVDVSLNTRDILTWTFSERYNEPGHLQHMLERDAQPDFYMVTEYAQAKGLK